MCQMHEQSFADSFLAKSRPHEKVLKIEAGLPLPGRVIEEPKRKSRWLTMPIGNFNVKRRFAGKTMPPKIFRRGDSLFRGALVLGKFADDSKISGMSSRVAFRMFSMEGL